MTMNSKNVKTITLPNELKQALDEAKVSEYESYASVISRALKALKESQKS